MKHSAKTERFDNGTSSKPACKAPECKESHTESLHSLLTGEVSTATSWNMRKKRMRKKSSSTWLGGKCKADDNEGWKTPDYSWLGLEEENDTAVYYANVMVASPWKVYLAAVRKN